ncbi:MAG: hypothetical protein K5666_02305 [Bacilli bacterium]|nr:hypothetical protein [Bacilli bacterium]
MPVKNDDIVIVEGSKYLVLTTFEDSGIRYAFANQITPDEEDVTDIYYLFTDNNGQLLRVTDENIINRLAPIIQQGVEEALNNID